MRVRVCDCRLYVHACMPMLDVWKTLRERREGKRERERERERESVIHRHTLYVPLSLS